MNPNNNTNNNTNNGFIKDTEILMFNGEIKKIQDIQIGELVMGDNNIPLKVNNMNTNQDELYIISHCNNDDNYIVNKDFILTLNFIYPKNIIEFETYYSVKWFDNDTITVKSVKFSYNKKNKKKMHNSATSYLNNIKENRLVYIKVFDYLQLSEKMQSKLHGIKNLVTFYPKKTSFDPYMIGNLEGINIYGMVENTTISDKYKCNTTNIRFSYLAGVIDSYGYVQDDKYVIEIPEYNNYVNDLMFMIKSLLLNCIYKDGLLIIYGNKVIKIPTHKLKIVSLLNKYSNKLQAEKYEINTYYTLQFDKDIKFLLGNCIVV